MNQPLTGHLASLNPIRARILFSGLLLAAFVTAVCLHHNLVAWLAINPVQLMVRFSLPAPAAKSRHPAWDRCMGFILRTGLILFLILAWIHILHPFPPPVLVRAELFGLLYLSPVLAGTLYLDWSAFRQSGGARPSVAGSGLQGGAPPAARRCRVAARPEPPNHGHIQPFVT